MQQVFFWSAFVKDFTRAFSELGLWMRQLWTAQIRAYNPRSSPADAAQTLSREKQGT